ncbi:MAG TPA: N-6 DNA methylase [Myxococcaceae bacterium]|nr:N-6 DNA methylase [Myxococcaceae bacterium]
MELNAVLHELGFLKSPGYVAASELRFGDRRSHLFRKARSACSLRGVYFLGQRREERYPVVFVAEASSREQALAIHRSVWNLNVVPLLLVNTPEELCLFHSFQAPSEHPPVESARTLEEVRTKLRLAHAASIDSGQLWADPVLRASPAKRVDQALLRYVDQLAGRLQKEGVSPELAYALTARLLFLRYLRDRGIPEGWLEAGGFAVDLASVPEEHVRWVSAELLGASRFDFGLIPVETLSSVYQRLLHSTALGRKLGAYYTPSSLIEFVLGEVQALHPVSPRTTVLDPSCGAGSFLVHCFRRLVERFLEEHEAITPAQLEGLLTEHIFGVDRDAGACAVAQSSLLLTMLDYVDPRGLEAASLELPVLLGRNIVRADFFSSGGELAALSSRTFQWIVGNPPWMQANGERTGAEDKPVLSWIRQNAQAYPVASNQVAEAFTWKATQLCAAEGAVGLVLPAISLFKDNPRFRQALSGAFHLSCVANFSGFAEVLFENTATAACVVTLRPRPASEQEQTRVFSPLLLNQPESSMGDEPVPPLSITVNRAEVRTVSSRSLATVAPAQWKALVFAGPRDAALLSRLESTFPSLQEWLDRHHFEIFEGPQLRGEQSRDEKVFVPELVGKPTLVTERLRGEGRIHSIPEDALEQVPRSNAFLRLRGGLKPLNVCRPPHVIVGAALNFAAFSDQFIVVPPRQIGISGKDPDLLRMLSLFLCSTLVAYEQFFASPQGGIRGGRTTLESLRRMPCPLDAVPLRERQGWLSLQQRRAREVHGPTPDAEIDALVSSAFGLDEREVALVEDFVRISMPLTYGDRLGPAAQPPDPEELSAYAHFLAQALERKGASVQLRRGEHHGIVHVGGGLPPAEPGRQHAQWIYFDRNLLVSRGDAHCLFKPLQRFWWTRARALADADLLNATVFFNRAPAAASFP